MYFKLTIGFLLFITITGSLSSDWEIFKRDYEKEYDSIEEEIQRKKIFLDNVNRMKEYRQTHPDASFTMGINHLTDRRINEFISNSKLFSNLHSEDIEEPIHLKIIIPTRLDWRDRHVITPVANQSIMGLSPAIVAVEVIESYQAIKTRNITRGSVDQVTACCGNVIGILDCVLNKTDGSLCSQESYSPFNGTCNPSECQPFVTFDNVKKINPPKETTMLEWIQDSTLFVAIDASQLSFQTYKTGIYSESDCSKTEVNHALQLVGYGFRSGIPYWLCKNSWGEGWGERGYVLIERGKNICGITSYVVQIGAKPNVNNAMMNEKNQCPSIYQGVFSNPLLIEKFILIIYSIIFLVGLVGNIMTIIIIKYNAHLRTPTNFYLLNLAVSDLMMLMCNLPLEMIEIYNRQWPLSIIFCKLRNICAEFFTCSSILTILAFTCERYFAIVHPLHLHRLNHFRRAQYIIMIIWILSLGFSLPFGLLYETEPNSSLEKKIIPMNICKSCVPKKSLAKILSIISIISSLCLFYFPMLIIGAIYLFIAKALRRVVKYEGCSNPIELSTSSYSSLSNKEAVEIHQRSNINSSMRARCQARQVVIKTLVAVVIGFFVCYAPLYLQRLVVAITTLKSNTDSNFLAKFMGYLYFISGVTFYLGSIINPILYNVVSNKYRRAFLNLFCCRLKTNQNQLNTNINEKLYPTNHLQINYYIKKTKSLNNIPLTNQQLSLNINRINTYLSKSNTSLHHFSEKNNYLTPPK